MIEAYVYLRRRAGEGSPLPSKGEVKRMAALMWAFSDCGLVEKLPEYLWKNAETNRTAIYPNYEAARAASTRRDSQRLGSLSQGSGIERAYGSGKTAACDVR